MSIKVSLESVGLFISNPSLVVLVEVVPGILESVGKVVGYLVGVQLVGGLEHGTGSEFSIILHEELLSSLVSGGSSAFLRVVGVD